MGFDRTAASGSLTGVSPRPMLVGAPRNAVWAFNAGRTRRLARHKRNVSDLPYAAPAASRRAFFVKDQAGCYLYLRNGKG